MFNSILFTFVHILIASLWIQQYPVHWRQTLLCMLKSTNQRSRRVVNCDNPLVAKFWDARSTETARVADGDSLQHTGRSHANTVFWHPAERGVCDPQHPRPVRQGIRLQSRWYMHGHVPMPSVECSSSVSTEDFWSGILHQWTRVQILLQAIFS